MARPRVLVAEPLGDAGIDLLGAHCEVDQADGLAPAELLARIAQADALIVRSATRVTAEVLAAGGSLRVVVRAGAGIDNIDLDAATARGVVVMNTPGGNTYAAAEHTMALMLALARKVPMAAQSLREGRWERDRFVGWELRGKVLGLIGVGRIGTEVAARAQAFRMRVVGHDPFLGREALAAHDVTPLTLDELLQTADVVSLHVPLGDATRALIGAAEMARMKRGSHLINCARGGLIDEAALLAALDSGQLAGAALDVFATEPEPDARLVRHPKVVATPHLGASTSEAKESVGIQAARQVIGVLEGTSFENAVNLPIQDPAVLARLRPYLDLAEQMGSFQAQLASAGVRAATLEVAGEFEDVSPLQLAYLKGLLTPVVDGPVNYVNATYLARDRGIRTAVGRTVRPPDYATLLTGTVVTDAATMTVRGTVIGEQHPRLVEIDGFRIDAIPLGNLVVCRSHDRPGVIGEIGACCGARGLNISEFRLGRQQAGREALSIITFDSEPSLEDVAQIGALPNLIWARRVVL